MKIGEKSVKSREMKGELPKRVFGNFGVWNAPISWFFSIFNTEL